MLATEYRDGVPTMSGALESHLHARQGRRRNGVPRLDIALRGKPTDRASPASHRRLAAHSDVRACRCENRYGTRAARHGIGSVGPDMRCPLRGDHRTPVGEVDVHGDVPGWFARRCHCTLAPRSDEPRWVVVVPQRNSLGPGGGRDMTKAGILVTRLVTSEVRCPMCGADVENREMSLPVQGARTSVRWILASRRCTAGCSLLGEQFAKKS
jgi:hypothetical protein